MGKSLGTIISIGIAIFAPYAAAAIGLSGFAATAFGIGLQFAASSLFSSKSKRGGGGGVADSGLLINKTSNTSALPVVYGSRRLGGTRVYLQSTNNDGETSGTEYLHVVLAYANGGNLADATFNMDGPSATKILLNDKVAWTSGGGVISDSHPDYDANDPAFDKTFDGFLDIATFRGPTDQTHSVGREYNTFDDFDARKSDEWSSNHRLRGVAYIYARMKFDRDKFPGAPTILVESNGMRVADVTKIRAGTTNADTLRTHSRHSNPANVLYDYLTNNLYGKGLAAADIDIDSFHDASNYYDTIGMTFDGVVETSDTLYNNVQNILGSSNTNMYYSRGQYSIKVNKQESFSGAFEFNTSNIIGEWTISLGSKKNRFNTVKVNYFDPTLDWQPNSLKLEKTAYLTADNNIVNEGTIDLTFIASEAMATKLGNFYLDSSRYMTIVTFKASHEALKLDVNDTVYVDHEVPGWTGANKKKMRVSAIVLNSDSTVDVTLQEYAPDSVYIENQ